MFIPDSAYLYLCACSQGVFIYWLTSTSFSIVSALLLRVSAVRGVLGMGDIAKHPEPAKSESTWSTMKEGEWVVRIQGREGGGEGGREERKRGGRGGRGRGGERGEGRGGKGDILQELLRNNLSILDFCPAIAMFMRYTKLSSNYQFLSKSLKEKHSVYSSHGNLCSVWGVPKTCFTL